MRSFRQLSYEFLKWKNIVNNINRYYDQSTLLDILYDNASLIEYEISAGRHFYRGRVFDLDEVVSTNGEYLDWVDDKKTSFQGYNKRASGAPPVKNAMEGRLNGKGISFLYTCKDISTVICELRPTIHEKISVAEFITRKKLIFADLTIIKAKEVQNNNQLLSDLLRKIAEEFSIPHYAGHNYSFTQYLAGHFANMGFHGIVFKSSLDPQGENYVFFNPKDCEAINSQLFMVDDISIQYSSLSRIDFQYLDN